MTAWAALEPLAQFLLAMLVVLLIWGIWEAWLTHRTPPVDADPADEHLHNRRFEDR